MRAYKGFRKDLTCRGHKFREGEVNVTQKANCVKNGFHCAEDPLDCFSYYPELEDSVYCLVEAAGDIDEDGWDSKISCTELTIIKRLTVREMVEEALRLRQERPYRYAGECEEIAEGNSCGRGYAVARGARPKARGNMGDVIGLAEEAGDPIRIISYAAVEIDGEAYKPGIWYTIKDGKVQEAEG